MDMRKNIDILFAVVRFQISLNPYMKDFVFIFMSKNLHIMKLLSWPLSFRINKNPFD